MANLFKSVDAGTYLAATSKIAAMMTPEEMVEINDESGGTDLVKAMLAAMREKLASRMILFTTPVDQIAAVRSWNDEFGLGFTEADLAEAQRTMPAAPAGRLVAAVLVPYLDTVQATFDFLWGRAVAVQTKGVLMDGLRSDSERLSLTIGVVHPGHRLRWEVIDLGANVGVSPMVASLPAPHAGVIAAMALHPEWVRAMGRRRDVPRPCLPGYACTGPVGQAWVSVPSASYNAPSGTVTLGMTRRCVVGARMSVPALVW